MTIVLSNVKPPIRDSLQSVIQRSPSAASVELVVAQDDEALRDADIWVVGVKPTGRYSAQLINGCPELKGIVMSGIGYDQIDVEAASVRGVYVANAPEFAVSVAEAAMTLLLAIAKKYPVLKLSVEQGIWPAPSGARGSTLAGKTLGIIGLGNIGSHIARYGHAFNMTVLAVDPAIDAVEAGRRGASELVDKPELLRRSDAVMLCCKLDDGTYHLIDREALALMKPTAFLVNVARGALVDEAALIDALREEKIAGAGLDVLEREPPAAENPLLVMHNVVVTPHSLGATVENSTIIAKSVWRSIESIARGERPKNAVSPVTRMHDAATEKPETTA